MPTCRLHGALEVHFAIQLRGGSTSARRLPRAWRCESRWLRCAVVAVSAKEERGSEEALCARDFHTIHLPLLLVICRTQRDHCPPVISVPHFAPAGRSSGADRSACVRSPQKHLFHNGRPDRCQFTRNGGREIVVQHSTDLVLALLVACRLPGRKNLAEFREVGLHQFRPVSLDCHYLCDELACQSFREFG